MGPDFAQPADSAFNARDVAEVSLTYYPIEVVQGKS